MEHVASLLKTLLYGLDDAELEQSEHRVPGLPDPHARVDTLALELETMHHGFGEALPLLAMLTGCGNLESCSDIDRLAIALMMQGL